jgi:ABC-2 type transport system permease protein
VILHSYMKAIVKKELGLYFSGLIGYFTIGIFLLVSGFFLFIMPDTNILDAGYASMDSFFEFAPYIMLFLIPAITMKSFSDEYRNGTFELLSVLPIKKIDLVLAKYFSALLVASIAVLSTVLYLIPIYKLSTGGIDSGGILGSYIGLFLLCGIFTAIGVYASSFQSNAVVSFLLSAILCYVFYAFFSSIASVPLLKSGLGYYISLLGIRTHYENISKGYVDSRDLVYFLSVVSLFIFLTTQKIKSH